MKTLKLLLFFCMLTSFQVFSQGTSNSLNSKTVKFGDCDLNGITKQAEKAPVWKQDEMNVCDYLNKNIKDKQLKKAKKGKVVIAVIILPTGKACCSSFLNLSDRELDAYAFKNAVNAMPDWTPAMQDGKEVKTITILVFDVKKGKLTTEPTA